MSEVILTCGCGDTDAFSKDAFRILFPLEEVPQIVHDLPPTSNKLLRQVVNGLKDGVEKYAYFLLYTSQEVQVWDLLKGIRIR